MPEYTGTIDFREDVFDPVRLYAYAIYKDSDFSLSKEQFLSELNRYAQSLDFSWADKPPASYKVAATVKNCVDWCLANMTAEGLAAYIEKKDEESFEIWRECRQKEFKRAANACRKGGKPYMHL
jgi:hypothetical protein